MTVRWFDHDGIITCMPDGRIPDPFMYIVAKNPPPWKIESLGGTLAEFDSLEAAQLSLLIRLGDTK